MSGAVVSDPMWLLEGHQLEIGCSRVAGVDEAGRGAWAGPLAVAAVILPLDHRPRPYRDSKVLSPQRRQELAHDIRAEAIAWAVEFASAREIETFGPLRATHRAALRAISGLNVVADGLITDFLKLETDLPIIAVPRADASSYSVAAASVLAKTGRDALMCELDALYPGYGFAQHKGYGVAEHRSALQRLGPCPEHRRSFRPVQTLVAPLFDL